MKNLATLFAMTFVGLGTALAQGTIDFHNPGGASGFPVTVIDAAGNVTKIGDTAAGSPLGPASVRVGLFVGANGTPFSGMTMVGLTTNSASSASLAIGTFFGGNPYVVPGFATGTTISFAFAAWSITTGALTYPDALIAGQGYVSHTPVVGNGYTLAGGAGTPPLTWGDKTLAPPAGQPWMVSGLQLQPVPEPSTIVLGLLGAGALLLRRRK